MALPGWHITMLSPVGLASGQGHAGRLDAGVGKGLCRVNPLLKSLERLQCAAGEDGRTARCRLMHHGVGKCRTKEARKRARGQTLEEGSKALQVFRLHSALQSVHETAGSEKVQQYLERVYDAMGLQGYRNHEHMRFSGVQVLMGMEGQWRFTWSIDGRFHERFDGLELCYEWAYNGEDEPWHVDAAGRVSSLELDDREVCLVSSWVRTGFWLTAEGQKQLLISLEWLTSDTRQTKFKVQLKNSQVETFVVVDNSTWLPTHVTIKAYGGEDNWEFSNWQPILPGHRSLFPKDIIHKPPPGGVDMYTLTNVNLEGFDNKQAEKEISSVYLKPTKKVVQRTTRRYPKTHINNDLNPTVVMFEAESGHYLVKPLIDGKEAGYFIVDTGASSLTIAPQVAEELGMDKFGEAFVTGVDGKVRCQFRRAKSFQIGPITITDPMFMELPMSGVVRGVSPVSGICGYDLFFHCVVEMSYKDATLSLYDPLLYKSSWIDELEWQGLYLLENVPHIPAIFNGNEAIFLLDTGAGGVDIIFHGRSVKLYRLNQILKLAGTATMKGINTAAQALQVEFGILDSLRVAGQSFQNVKALYPATGRGCGYLDFSTYTAGVLCGDLLQDLVLVLDYGNRRFALLDCEREGASR